MFIRDKSNKTVMYEGEDCRIEDDLILCNEDQLLFPTSHFEIIDKEIPLEFQEEACFYDDVKGFYFY